MRLKRVCPTCGGDGWTMTSPNFCPDCKAEAKNYSESKSDTEIGTSNLDSELLADLSTKLLYTRDKMERLCAHILTTPAYIQFTKHVGDYLNDVARGRTPKINYMLGCSNLQVLESIANASNFMTLRSGKKAFPYVDSITLYNLFTTPSLLYSNRTFSDAVEADNLPIFVATEGDLYKSFSVLTYIISVRGVQGKSTLLLTSTPIKNMFSKNIMQNMSTARKFNKMFSNNPNSLYEIGCSELFMK